MDFSTLQGLTIPEGVVTQIAKDGIVLWALNTGGGDTVILEVEKVTSNTYAGETTYENEEFILLDIYPKTNGTVNVTYGGLTKTITDKSGVEEPNAQQVFFGTFNGVSDSVATPTSGTLTIEGDYYAFGGSAYAKSSKDMIQPRWVLVRAIHSYGKITMIVDHAFGEAACCITQESIEIPNTIISIGERAFHLLLTSYVKTVIIGENVKHIGCQAFAHAVGVLTVKMLPTTPPTIGTRENTNGSVDQYAFITPSDITNENYIIIIVPKGCGNAYKTAEGWSVYADYIVEAS